MVTTVALRLFLASQLVLAAWLAAPSQVLNAQEAVDASTEFGVTIKPQQVFNAIEESMLFWPAVSRHVASDQIKSCNPESQRHAAVLLEQAHGHLQDRLMGENEADGRDMIDYLGCQLRKLEFYRQLRVLLEDDAAFLGLYGDWEKSYFALRALPCEERAAAIERLVADMRGRMSAAGILPAKIEQAMSLWARQAECMRRSDQTQAGQMLLSFEQEARVSDPKAAWLVRGVVLAAGWAKIIKSDDASLCLKDFVQAWQTLYPEKLAVASSQ